MRSTKICPPANSTPAHPKPADQKAPAPASASVEAEMAGTKAPNPHATVAASPAHGVTSVSVAALALAMVLVAVIAVLYRSRFLAVEKLEATPLTDSPVAEPHGKSGTEMDDKLGCYDSCEESANDLREGCHLRVPTTPSTASMSNV